MATLKLVFDDGTEYVVNRSNSSCAACAFNNDEVKCRQAWDMCHVVSFTDITPAGPSRIQET